MPVGLLVLRVIFLFRTLTLFLIKTRIFSFEYVLDFIVLRYRSTIPNNLSSILTSILITNLTRYRPFTPRRDLTTRGYTIPSENMRGLTTLTYIGWVVDPSISRGLNMHETAWTHPKRGLNITKIDLAWAFHERDLTRPNTTCTTWPLSMANIGIIISLV